MSLHTLAVECPICGAPPRRQCASLTADDPFRWVRRFSHEERKALARTVPLDQEEVESHQRHSQSAHAGQLRRYAKVELEALQSMPKALIRTMQSIQRRQLALREKANALAIRRGEVEVLLMKSGVPRALLQRLIEKEFKVATARPIPPVPIPPVPIPAIPMQPVFIQSALGGDDEKETSQTAALE